MNEKDKKPHCVLEIPKSVIGHKAKPNGSAGRESPAKSEKKEEQPDG